MLRFKSFILCGSLVCWFAGGAFSSELESSDSSSTLKKDAKQLALQALKAEAKGDLVARQQLLGEAITIDPNCQLVKSLTNEIQTDGQWLSIDDSIKQCKSSVALNDYERRRNSRRLNVEEHFVLGEWCLSQNLMPQAQAHFNRTIQLAPNHSQARLALGYRWIGGEWISAEQIAAAEERAETAKRAIEQFGPKFRAIHHWLSSPRLAKREEAAGQLMAITDPTAVMAVEAIFSGPSPEVSSVVVKWLAAIDTVETSQVLARYALMHPNQQVCRQAAEALRTRPLFDFAPQLIAMTVSPVATTLIPTFDADGSLAGYRQAFSQESATQRKVIVLDSAYLPASMEAGTSDNEIIAARNRKIAEVLSFVNKQPIPSNAQGIWQWWDRYNESESQLQKSTSVRHVSLSSSSSPRSNDFAPPTPSRDQIAAQRAAREFYYAPRIRSECLVAGTPVMTQKGLIAVENVSTGDMVLSREIGSGALQWKPVIEATKRPPEITHEVCTSGQTLRCTGGHLFWVSGKGWTKASELQKGSVLHCAGEPTVVKDVETMSYAPTFNLLVADNSNYFIGPELVLTHDVSERQPTRIRVPGLNELVSDR